MDEALPYIVAGIMLSFGTVGLWWKYEWREYAKLRRHFRALMVQRATEYAEFCAHLDTDAHG